MSLRRGRALGFAPSHTRRLTRTLAAPAALASLAALVAPAAVHAQRAPAAVPPRVQLGVRVSADTVLVGQPFRLLVRVRAPIGATIAFPDPPDTTGTVQPLGQPGITAGADPAAVERTAVYPLAAWDVDSQSVSLGDVVVRVDGAERRVAVGRVPVFVRSVLPEDTALHVPKPARELIVTPVPWPWWWWLLAALAVAALVGGWYWWRRRRGRATETEDPFVRAEREFARVEHMALVDAGERGRHVALMVEVLRDYLAARVPAALRSHTSGELLRATRELPAIPGERLSRVLRESDLVKFARFPVTAERAVALGVEARLLARAVEDALRAEEAARLAAVEAQRAAARKAA